MPLNRCYWSVVVLKNKQNLAILLVRMNSSSWGTGELWNMHLPIFQHTTRNIKAVFFEDSQPTVICVWKAKEVYSEQKHNLALCSFQILANTLMLPARDITMSDHEGHQVASRQHQSITTGLCWPAICHQLPSKLEEGHAFQSLCSETKTQLMLDAL